MARFFIDTEFAETGGSSHPTIDLISIGLVSDDDREYYAESSEFSLSNCNGWVIENVLPRLGPQEQRKRRPQIKEEIIAFIGDDPDVEFWGYYSDYDWVVFCWLFGTMMHLPKGFPMLCMDLQQAWIREGKPPIKPPDPENEHNALADARWNFQFYRSLHIHVCAKERGWPTVQTENGRDS